jgi:hypothetical protein
MIFYAAGANRPELLRVVAQARIKSGVLTSYGDCRPGALRHKAAQRVVELVCRGRVKK